jgi:hypothetical protein
MNKRLFITPFLLVSIVFCSAQKKNPTISITKKFVQLDTIPFNVPIIINYEFKNTGKSNLIIENIIASCGCTLAQWPKNHIKKRKKGIIKLTYNAGIKGTFYKTLLVESNAQNSPTPISIQGYVR